MVKVVMKVRMTMVTPSSVLVPTILQVINVASVTNATLMKLLQIRIVARSFFGSLMSLYMIFFECCLLFLQLAICCRDSEKKATSDPDTMADKSNRIARVNPPRE